MPKLFILAGPSGTGKTTIMRRLDAENRLPGLHYIHATLTSRAPRPDEVNGVHFHFVSRAELDRLHKEGRLLEYAVNHGNAYGTPHSFVPDDRDAMIIFDIGAAIRTREKRPGTIILFLEPHSIDDLPPRLQQRGETPESIERRMETARHELTLTHEADYVLPCMEGRLDWVYAWVAQIIDYERHSGEHHI